MGVGRAINAGDFEDGENPLERMWKQGDSRLLVV